MTGNRSDEAELIEAATKAYIDATTSGNCTDRWPRACSMCDCFRDGNAGPGCDAFAYDRQIITHTVAPLLAALAASRADNERLRAENRVIREAWDVTDAEFAAAAARVEYARQALIADGYFTEDEVGEDVAPRITERLAAARVEVSQLRAKIDGLTGICDRAAEFGSRMLYIWKIRAALAEPLGSTPEQEQSK